MNRVRTRLFLPVAMISVCLLVLCAVTATSLFSQQAEVTRILRENVESRRAAVELEECLSDLIALEDDSVETVTVLHDRLKIHLVAINETADQAEEIRLAKEMNSGFDNYLAQWNSLPLPGQTGHESARKQATRFLEAEVLQPCTDFKLFNAKRIESSATTHERSLRNLAWGMAFVGGLGAVAGIVFGYGYARGVSQSIRQLQIQLKNVTGKLNPVPAEIVITELGDVRDLHAEADRLAERVERTLEELAQREREISRAEQLAAVGQLAAGVAHEIRNPLTSIKMLVQSARDDQSPLAGDDLVIIESEIRRLEKSLQQFLDFARPPKPDRRPTNLNVVVRDILDLLRVRAERAGVYCDFQPSSLPITIHADESHIRQVILNLALNALDFMPRGGTLTISLAKEASAVRMEIADTGPGISQEMQSKLFQPFASSKETGLGLGLVISRRIIEEHGGTIQAANRAGGGASFVVTLPYIA